MASSLKNLIIWQKAYSLVLDIYNVTNTFPKHEIYSITAQFRRAAFSIIANIAEGYTRPTVKEKIRFYTIAKGSLEECKCCAMLCHDLLYADMNQKLDEMNHVGILLNRYIKKLQQTPFDQNE